MNKKNTLIPLVTACGLLSGAWLPGAPVVLAQEIKTGAPAVVSIQTENGMDAKAKQPTDVRWVIRFNTPIERYTVDDSALFVKDESGNKVSVTLVFGDKDQTITVKPPTNGYGSGQTYFLCVNDSIYAKSGKKLSASVTQRFQIQNEIVSIQGDKDHTFFIGKKEVWRSGKENFLPTTEQGKNLATPQLFKELSDIKTIVNGKEHFLALTNDGTVWAWGTNKSGELGDGTNQSRNTPVQVKGLSDVIEVVAANDSDGNGYSLALTKDGTIYAWGSNKYGQLGLGEGAGAFVKTPTRVLEVRDIASIAGGQGHAFAVKNDGTVYAWGRNNEGQLGDDTTKDRYIPVRIDDLKGISRIVMGTNHIIAFQRSGNMYAWGNNDFGQLGNGSNDASKTPVQVNFLSDVQQLFTVGDSNFALKSDGTVWAWGKNDEGQLGDGTRENRLMPVKIEVLTKIKMISVSEDHGLALDEDGKVWAWGKNNQGQLGIGKTEGKESSVPVQVGKLSNIKQVYAKSGSSFAIGEDGTVWAWGENGAGQLGEGTAKNQPAPAKTPTF
ncbi:hypothetical protein P4S93_00735 [Aneurinibacillus thermoaerophilus]|uniref:RCC1 domain-containing protein n=1 Tax=Aneurinibacillus thermoaerophilus TaxID=143495 RepID=UPI002E1F849F|nr:hypothetical protein [Aneurinibacillus thermoaerophilus]MED0759316.1 hypothetical protein [Aneurinibacillus thermoaerophilus]